MITGKDLLILRELRNNSRQSLTKINEKTSIPVSTIFDRIKFLEEHLNLKHSTIFDFSKAGYDARIKCLISIKKEEEEKLDQFLISHQNINSAFKLNKRYNYLIGGVFKNFLEAENFIRTLKKEVELEDMMFFYVTSEVKKEGFVLR